MFDTIISVLPAFYLLAQIWIPIILIGLFVRWFFANT